MINYSLCLLWLATIFILNSHGYIIKNSTSSANSIPSSTQKDATKPARQPLVGSVQSQQQAAIDNGTSEESSFDLEQFWLNERDQFFNLTSFNLTKVSNKGRDNSIEITSRNNNAK